MRSHSIERQTYGSGPRRHPARSPSLPARLDDLSVAGLGVCTGCLARNSAGSITGRANWVAPEIPEDSNVPIKGSARGMC